MRTLIATTLLAAALVAAAPAQEEKKEQPVPEKKEPEKKEPEKQDPKEPPKPTDPPTTDPMPVVALPIEGGYTVAAAERDGQPLPKADFADAIVRIVGGRIVGTDRNRHEFLVATYTLDEQKKSPWDLEMKLLTDKTDTVRGRAKKDGFVVTIIYALPGGPAPTEFKTKKGQQMFVLRGFVLDPLPGPSKFSSSP